MASVVYALCALTSLACAVLLLRAYRRSWARLLFWSGLCFVGLALNNVLLCDIPTFWSPGSDTHFYGAHLTMDHVTNSTIQIVFTNSLFVATSGFSGGSSGAITSHSSSLTTSLLMPPVYARFVRRS